MDKKSWKNFKKRVLTEIWRISNFPFIRMLFQYPSIEFLKNFKHGDKIFYEYLKWRFFIKRKMPLPWLKIFVTTRCTMNCKYCNTYLPQFKNHSKLMTFEEFKSDLDKVLSAVDFIHILELVGGEPLLNKDLPKMISYALSKKQVHRIVLPTNATILPNQELLEAMKNKRLTVQVSDYSHVKNLPANVTVKYEEFKKILRDNKILFSNFQETQNANTWFTVPELYKDRMDEKTVSEHFDTCFAKYCSGIIDGALVPCMGAMFMYKNMELSQEIKDELINVRKIDSAKVLSQKLIQYYSKSHSEFCHFCHHENIKTGMPCGEQA